MSRARLQARLEKLQRLARTIEARRLVEFVTCWGDEIPADWQEGTYFKTEWGHAAIDEAEDDA